MYANDSSHKILCEVWPALRDRRLRIDYYHALIAHLRRELTILMRSPNPVKDSDLHRALERLHLLRKNMDKPLGELFEALKREGKQFPGIEISRFAEFLTRAWITIELDMSSFSARSTETTPLHVIIQEKFNRLIPLESAMATGTLNRLTMKHLIDTFGWTVSWTSDLTEHLSVNSRTKVVVIYEHKICLLHHFEFEDHGICPIPKDAIREALDTLNLLFPPDDIPTQKYLDREGKPFYRLGTCGRGVHYRNLTHYRYWHKGLTYLLRASEEEPIGFKQFRLDKEHRNFREVTTFWLAVVVIIFLTLGFGIISSVFAAKSYQVALMQYKLDLAQACSAPGATVSLPHYCA
ncbi:hypothetical protein F5Y08DRAFT_320267 [Xylaria arbuscula]|nr:hypothetical protein F5Y08DRAFT_320267 [Xylaria arbuscula]